MKVICNKATECLVALRLSGILDYEDEPGCGHHYEKHDLDEECSDICQIYPELKAKCAPIRRGRG